MLSLLPSFLLSHDVKTFTYEMIIYLYIFCVSSFSNALYSFALSCGFELASGRLLVSPMKLNCFGCDKRIPQLQAALGEGK